MTDRKFYLMEKRVDSSLEKACQSENEGNESDANQHFTEALRWDAKLEGGE